MSKEVGELGFGPILRELSSILIYIERKDENRGYA